MNQPVFRNASRLVASEIGPEFHPKPQENREEAEAKFKDIAEALKKWMGVSKNSGTPKIIHFNKAFHYKPSILGYPYFWKHPDGWQVTIRLPFGDFGIFSGAKNLSCRECVFSEFPTTSIGGWQLKFFVFSTGSLGK